LNIKNSIGKLGRLFKKTVNQPKVDKIHMAPNRKNKLPDKSPDKSQPAGKSGITLGKNIFNNSIKMDLNKSTLGNSSILSTNQIFSQKDLSCHYDTFSLSNHGNFSPSSQSILPGLNANDFKGSLTKDDRDRMKSINDSVGVGTNSVTMGVESANVFIRNQFKSATSWKGWTGLRSSQQEWRTARVLGKTGASSLKWLSATGSIAGELSASYSTYKVASQYMNGGLSNVQGWDVADAAVGWAGTTSTIVLLMGTSNPVGWAVIGIGATGYGIFRTGQFIFDSD
jgi:hypothetical protein